jgi:hypothetical protein
VVHILLLLAALSEPADVSALSWLAGCWRGTSGSRTVDEMWMAPSGGGMLGAGRTVSGDRIVDHEFLQIRVQDGRLVYIAKPARQPEASFTAAAVGPREVVFENLEHDFPQRVIYRLSDDLSLSARIEGTSNGRPRAVDFPMRRVPCPGAP